MRIHGWHIRDFGILHEYRLEGLSPRLNVFLGPNEAGKSTLLAFIQRMLFGFSHPSPEQARFEPVHGGKPGGWLFLTGDDDPRSFGIERVAGRHGGAAVITLSDGDLRDDAWLSERLSGVDRAVFESLFAFSLTELQDFSSLDRERIRDRLFSVGIVGSGPDALAIAGLFGRRAAAFTDPQSRAWQALNVTLSEIRSARARLDQALAAAAGYEDLLRSRESWQESLQSGWEEMEGITARAERIRTLLEAHPAWIQLQGLRESLRGIPDGPSYPSDGLHLLARLDQRQEDLSTELAAIEARIRDRSAALNEGRGRLTDAYPPLAAELERFGPSVVLQENRIQRLQALRERSDQAAAERNARFVQLPGQWEFESVQAFTWGAEERARLSDWGSSLGDLDRRLSEAVRAEAAAQDACARLRRAVSEHEKQYGVGDGLETGGDPAVVRARIRAFREGVGGRAAVDSDLRAGAAAIELLEGAFEEAADALRKAEAQARNSMVLTAVWALLLGAVGIGGLVLSDFFLGGVLLLLGACAMVIGLRVCRAFRDARDRAKARVDEHSQRLSELRSDRAAQEEALTQRTAGLRESATQLGFAELPDESELAALEQALLDRERSTMRRGMQQDRFSELAAELARAEAARDELTARRTVLERERQELAAGWNEWKAQAGLGMIEEPGAVEGFLALMRVAKEKLEAVQAIHRELDELQREISDWNAEAGGMLKRAGWEPPREKGMEAFLAPIRALTRDVMHDAEVRAELEIQQGEIRSWTQDTGVLRNRLDEVQRERSALLAEVGVETPGEFRAGLERQRQRDEWTAQAKTLEAGLTRGRHDLAAFLEELKAGAPEVWEAELRALTQRKAGLQADRDEGLQELVRLEDRIEDLAQTAEVADAALAMEVGKARLAAIVEQWSVYRLAEGLVRESLHRFVQERQPAVMAIASGYYERVTNGRYCKVLQNEGGNGLLLQTSDGDLQDPRVLSRGAIEQLYLCLRLGLIAEYGQNGCRLPLVMDDVLVNFDPARARATAELLLEFSATNQVLLFTCHPSTAGMISELGEQVAVWSLGEGG